jgi:hypothetical protein
MNACPHATRETRAICVLLGGSGLAREPVIRPAVLPALLKPAPPVSRQVEQAMAYRAAA